MTDEPAQVKRTREIEEVTNRYVIHPISRVLVTYFDRWGLRPNTVSVIGMGLGAGAAVAYYHYPQWPMALLGFLLMVGWHVMDGADGQLARLTGQTSEVGKILDGLCDHVTFVLVYASLAMAVAQNEGLWVWGPAALAGISHVMQASTYEFQRQAYDFWARGKESARIVTPKTYREMLRDQSGVTQFFERLYLLYLKIQHRMARADAALTTALEAVLQEADDEHRIRDAYRSIQRSGVRRWSLLCSNYRTMAIFVACLVGHPLYFFVFEIVVLNAIFVLLMRMQQERNRRLRTWLARREWSSSGRERSFELFSE